MFSGICGEEETKTLSASLFEESDSDTQTLSFSVPVMLQVQWSGGRCNSRPLLGICGFSCAYTIAMLSCGTLCSYKSCLETGTSGCFAM